MNKAEISEFKDAVEMISQIGILIALDVYNLEEGLALAKNTLLERSTLAEDVMENLLEGIPIIIEKITDTVTEQDIREIRTAAMEEEISLIDFVKQIKIGSYNDEEEGPDEEELARYLALPRESRVSSEDIDENQKSVGQEVMIGHPLFTNMIVTSDGVQMPCESFTIPAAPELARVKARVLAINSKAAYKCGACNRNHQADIKIEFEDTNIIFYINNDFLIPYVDEKR
jgi:hypothetical protein